MRKPAEALEHLAALNESRGVIFVDDHFLPCFGIHTPVTAAAPVEKNIEMIVSFLPIREETLFVMFTFQFSNKSFQPVQGPSGWVGFSAKSGSTNIQLDYFLDPTRKEDRELLQQFERGTFRVLFSPHRLANDPTRQHRSTRYRQGNQPCSKGAC